MATTIASALAVPLIYEGVPIHARGFALAAAYDSSWRPPQDSDWAADQRKTNVWRHPNYPRHVVWRPAEDDAVDDVKFDGRKPTWARTCCPDRPGIPLLFEPRRCSGGL